MNYCCSVVRAGGFRSRTAHQNEHQDRPGNADNRAEDDRTTDERRAGAAGGLLDRGLEPREHEDRVGDRDDDADQAVHARETGRVRLVANRGEAGHEVQDADAEADDADDLVDHQVRLELRNVVESGATRAARETEQAKEQPEAREDDHQNAHNLRNSRTHVVHPGLKFGRSHITSLATLQGNPVISP